MHTTWSDRVVIEVTVLIDFSVQCVMRGLGIWNGLVIYFLDFHVMCIQNNKEILRDQLKIQEKQLLFNLATALDTYGNQKTNVDVSRRVYTSLKLKYEQGLISGLDLINADNNYLKAESEYINAMMQVLNSRLQLEKLYGNIHQ